MREKSLQGSRDIRNPKFAMGRFASCRSVERFPSSQLCKCRLKPTYFLTDAELCKFALPYARKICPKVESELDNHSLVLYFAPPSNARMPQMISPNAGVVPYGESANDALRLGTANAFDWVEEDQQKTVMLMDEE